MALRHPRCLLRHAGSDDGSFAPLTGTDAGVNTGAPTTNPRFYLIGDGSFAPLTGSDAGLKTGAPTTNPRFYLISDGSFAPSGAMVNRRSYSATDGERCRCEHRRSYSS